MAELVKTENADVVRDMLRFASTFASLRFPCDSEVRALTERERREVRVLRSILEDVASRLAGGEDPYEWFSKGTSMPVGEVRPNTFQYACKGLYHLADTDEALFFFGSALFKLLRLALMWRDEDVVWADYGVATYVLGAIGLIDQRMAIPGAVEELSKAGEHLHVLYDLEEFRLFDERGEYLEESQRDNRRRVNRFTSYRFHN
ncbi:hypothetical protein R6G69_05600 [Actinotignum urinale]|uniref:hypothetical protein n=1 Tax=Actinotignum urinale TaxID=190146 RepID=UPI002A82BFED|nr:hypothetical protein [Actinotignum urinale]MDY5129467.1 hypothetical protein [Actinotignum urinale]